MKVFKVEQLICIDGWGNPQYKIVSPLFSTEESATKWMKEHYSEKDYTYNGYCVEVFVSSSVIID